MSASEAYLCPLTDLDRETVERARIKKRTDAAEEDASRATAILRRGSDYRGVYQVIDELRGIVVLHRADTHDAVATRPLTAEERQGRLL